MIEGYRNFWRRILNPTILPESLQALFNALGGDEAISRLLNYTPSSHYRNINRFRELYCSRHVFDQVGTLPISVVE